MRRCLGAYLLLAVLCTACFAPASPAQRVSDAARDLNVATRFGKMDMVASHVDASVRTDFLARRTSWGREIRLVDIDLAGVQVRDETHADVTVDISWVPLRDNILRSTRVSQRWEDSGQGWKMTREKRVAGDLGLFGEVMTVQDKPHPDVHLPSRTIGQGNDRD
jgi:hypothetical protein